MPAAQAFLTSNRQALLATQPTLAIPAAAGGVTCRDGSWRMDVEGRAIAFHSRDPQREADRQVEQLFASERQGSLIVAIGLGAGFLLDALERRGWAGQVVALEPEPQTVPHLLARRDLTDWIANGRLRLFTAPDFGGLSDVQGLFGDGSAAPAVYVNPALARLRPAPVDRARAAIGRLCHEARANAEARKAFGARYVLNTLRNLPAIATEGDAAALVGVAAHVPTVVIGAGPSLDDALPGLRAINDTALLICVDTALRPLLAAGVRPHLVVAVDPSDVNAQHLTDLPDTDGISLVAEGSLDPFAVASFRGRTFFFNVSDHQPWPWLRQLGHGVGRLRAWGSVLTTAFDLALQMGGNPVVFAGADLAYTSGRPYCRGVVFEHAWRRRTSWGEPLQQQWQGAIEGQSCVIEPDIAGRAVRTAPHLLAFRNWLLDQMQRHGDRQYVNATGAGILHGTPVARVSANDLRVRFTSPVGARALIARRHLPSRATGMLAAARQLAADAADAGGEAHPVLDVWERFAPGLSRPLIAAALHRAVDDPKADHAAPASPATPPDRHPAVAVEREWLSTLAASTRLVALRIAPEQFLSGQDGARVYRFRTDGARLACCTLRTWESAVYEDGQPLSRAFDAAALTAGRYRWTRDELHVRASDDTDPRFNGREYTVLVPPFVAYLERQTLDDILRYQL